MEVTITEILDDLRAADEITRRFERRYWLSSADFSARYQTGQLDTGEHTDDFAKWAAFYEIKQEREAALQKLSQERMRQLLAQADEKSIEIDPREPALSVKEAT